jgi:hypothetical protein
MTNLNRHKFVVLLARGADNKISTALSELQNMAGVEIADTSRSYFDVIIDEDTVDRTELESIINRNGAELHALPQAQLMDPISTKKIP